MIFKQIDSSVDKTRKTLALFNKDWNTYKSNWQNANGIKGKIGSIFTSSNTNTSIISNEQVQILRNWNNAVAHGCTSQETFNRIIANADDNTKMYFTGLNKGKGSIEGLKKAQNVANQSTIGLTIAQTALNMAISLGLTALISLIVKGYDKLANSVENCKERVDDLISSYKSALETANNNANRVEELADKYEKLSKGVNSLGENVSLTNEEYEEYNSLVNEIAEMFPTLVQGWTDEGTAVLNLKGNIEQLRDAYKEAQQEAYNLLIVSGKDSDGNDIIKQWEDTHDTGFWADLLDLGANDVGGGIAVSDALKQLKAIQNMTAEEYREIERITGEGSRKEIAELSDIEKDIVYGSYLYKALGLDSNVTDEAFREAQRQARALIQTYNAEIESALSDVETLANAYLMTNEDYDKLDEQSKTAASMLVNSLNADIANTFSSKEDVGVYVDKIVQSILSNSKAKDALKGLFTMDTSDMSVDEIKKQTDSYINTIAEVLKEDPIELKTRLGFDDSDTQPLINNVKEKLQDDFDSKVGELTLEELHIAAEQVEVPEGTLLSWDELIAKINDVQSSTLNIKNPISLFDKLTNSQESIDKFQSSIKSAADAYSTLMSGNYSSTNLVDSIQEINKAVTDMGGSLNWEFIDSQKNSLELLGNAIELISEKYAESVLSGAGIDVDSKFGQMLANNIIQAQKSTTQLEVLDDQIDSLQSAYKDLTDIVSTYNETGYITFDQLQILLEMEPQYLSCLVDENGQLQLNEAAMTALANKRLDDAEAQAVQQAITELGQLALQDEKTAVEKNAEAFTNAVDDLASYNTELANTIAEATVGASAIRDLNAAISGAESQGANDTQINTVLDNLKTKLQLIENVREKVASGGLGSVIKSGGGSSGSSSSSKDLWKEAYENELKELEHMHELGLISDEQYWQDRMDLNEKYFGESSGKHQKYLDEYRDNEEDILKGIKDLWKDYYDDRKNDLKDLISYAEKLYDKEIDGLESAKEQIEERRDAEEKYWQGRIDAIDNEIDALEDANDQRQRAIDLQEKQYQLQKAMHQRTILLYSENKGMHYVNDTKAERDARNDLDSANHDIKVADLKKQQDELQKQLDIILESYDAQIESINKQIDSLKEIKSAWSDIVDNQEFKELEERLKSLFGDDVKGNILSGNEDFLNSVIAQYSSTSDMLRTIEDATLADIQNMVAQYGILPENLMTITNAANDIANAFSTVDVSGFNTSLDNIAQSSDNVAEKVKNVTTSLNDMSNAISCGSSRSNNKTNKPTQNESDNKGTSLENAIQNETQTAIDAFDQHTDKITNEVIPAIHSATDEMNAFNAAADVDIEKTITIHYETIGNPGGVSGNAHAEGTVGNAFANGTGAYKGLPKAEKNALVSEYGQTEMTVLPNGKTIITDTPTIMDLPKDTVIYNEEQTKKIMDNKVDTSGNAHADGTDADGWITLADGRQIRPLQPGDRTYDMMQKVNAYLESIDYNIEKLTPNSFYERNREMNKMADQISYVSSITNNNRNVQSGIHVDKIEIMCPGVTSQQVVNEVSTALDKQLGHLSQRAMQEAYKR